MAHCRTITIIARRTGIFSTGGFPAYVIVIRVTVCRDNASDKSCIKRAAYFYPITNRIRATTDTTRTFATVAGTNSVCVITPYLNASNS